MRDGWISRVVGMVGEGRVVIIDFEKDRVPVGFEGAKVVLFVWVVVVTKVIIDGDGLDDPCDPSSPRAATPVVRTAVSTPVLRFWRRRSLRVRICSVFGVFIRVSPS
jgi:hypothetical protein